MNLETSAADTSPARRATRRAEESGAEGFRRLRQYLLVLLLAVSVWPLALTFSYWWWNHQDFILAAWPWGRMTAGFSIVTGLFPFLALAVRHPETPETPLLLLLFWTFVGGAMMLVLWPTASHASLDYYSANGRATWTAIHITGVAHAFTVWLLTTWLLRWKSEDGVK